MNRLRYIFVLALCFGVSLWELSALSDEPARPTTELSLDQCIELAAIHHVEVLNSGLELRAAVARKREAVAEYFPRVSVQALSFYAFDPLLEIGVTDILGHSDFTHNLQNILNSLAPQFGFSPYYSTLKCGLSANVSVSQPIFAGGRIITGNKLAALGVQASELQQSMTVRKTEREVEEAYWQIVSLQEKLGALEEAETLLDTLYRDVLSANGAGLALDSDLLQVKMKMNQVRVGRLQLENGIRLAKMNFFNSIGVNYHTYRTFGYRTDETTPYIDDIILTDTLQTAQPPHTYYLPEMEVAQAQEETKLLDLTVEAKRLEKRMAVGEALPQIAVGASYGYNNFIDKGSMNGLVFGMVQIPISDWGKTARKIQRLDAEKQMAENDRDFLQRQLVLQVHKLWLDLTAAWEQLQLSLESRDLARRLYDQMKSQYDAGLVPIADLLQAQTKLSEAEVSSGDSQIAYQNALRAYLSLR